MTTNDFHVLTPRDQKEADEANNAILKYRKKHNIEKYKLIISDSIAQSIVELGFTETKKIVEDIYYEVFRDYDPF